MSLRCNRLTNQLSVCRWKDKNWGKQVGDLGTADATQRSVGSQTYFPTSTSDGWVFYLPYTMFWGFFEGGKVEFSSQYLMVLMN